MITIDVRKSIQCNGEYSLFISFPYNDEVVQILRKQPTRYWNKTKKEWEVPANKLKTLIKEFDTKFDVTLTGYLDYFQNKPTVCTNIEGFNFKTKPFAHQLDGFNFGLNHDKWLLADEQGLGKTKQVIDIAVAKKIQKNYKHCLIVCGVNGLKWNWVNEIAFHSNEKSWILGQRTVKNKISIGSRKDKVSDILNLANNDAYFIITNVESLRIDEIHSALAQACKSGEINMVAIDEIHKCKNPSSQQGKGILKLQPEYRVAMTGTPIMNNPLDLYIVLRWLGYERHAFYSFKQHYCVMGGFGGYEVISYKNMDELDEIIHEIMLRRRKEDVLDLPEKLYVDEFVDMTTRQAQIYKEVTADIKAHIDQIKMTNNPLAELIRMRQATGFTGILSSDVRESAKLDRMEELVEEAVANSKKVVIFSNWTQMTDEISQRLHNYGHIIITGQTQDNERQECVKAFQEREDIVVAIGTVGAMGTGITLTAGTVVIFLDEPWNMALKDQAIDRCHRIGTTVNITIYTIMCKNTIDERIHNIVERKGAISDALIDGKIIGNKTEILNYLVG